jgi:hypothetical protein
VPNDEPWLDHVPGPSSARRQAQLDVKPSDYAAYEASWEKLKEVVAILHREGVRLVPGPTTSRSRCTAAEVVKSASPTARSGGATLGGAVSRRGPAERRHRARNDADLMLVEGDPTQISAPSARSAGDEGGVVYYPEEIYHRSDRPVRAGGVVAASTARTN